jgi:hypothetical protein
MAPTLNVLAESYGIGPRSAEHPQSLEAAQANLMASWPRAFSVASCHGT